MSNSKCYKAATGDFIISILKIDCVTIQLQVVQVRRYRHKRTESRCVLICIMQRLGHWR